MASPKLSVLEVLNLQVEDLRIELQNRQVDSKGLTKAQMQSELLKIMQVDSRPSSPATMSRVEVSSGLTPEMILQLEMKKLEMQMEEKRIEREREQEERRIEREREQEERRREQEQRKLQLEFEQAEKLKRLEFENAERERELLQLK